MESLGPSPATTFGGTGPTTTSGPTRRCRPRWEDDQYSQLGVGRCHVMLTFEVVFVDAFENSGLALYLGTGRTLPSVSGLHRVGRSARPTSLFRLLRRSEHQEL